MTNGEALSIEVVVDGSEQSQAALEWAMTEARLRHGKVRLITAWYYPPLASPVGDVAGPLTETKFFPSG